MSLTIVPSPPLLFQLDIQAPACRLSGDALRSLSSLSSLQHLNLGLNGICPTHLQHLSRLVDLHTCRIGLPPDNYDSNDDEVAHPLSLSDVAGCFALTRLTHLCFWTVEHTASLSATAAAAEGLTIAPLATLTNLRRLTLGPTFVVDDTIFSTLQKLTQLAELGIGRIQLAHPQPGHLPMLQRLETQRWSLVTQELETLLPLLPLPRLMCDPGNDWRMEVGCSGDDAAADVEAMAFRRTVQYLAAAPLLHLQSVVLSCKRGGAPLSGTSIARGLGSLASSLTSLTLDDLPHVGAEWGVLSSVLPHLLKLSLVECRVTEAGLAVLTSHWPSLAALTLNTCEGVSDEGWLGLAAGREHALTLITWPAISPHLSALMESVQWSKFKAQNLSFSTIN